MGSSKADLKAFPPAVMDDIGHQLFRVQCGLEPDDWKPMAVIGAGVREIRVLHCFQKKTQQTSQHEVELARKRLQDVLR